MSLLEEIKQHGLEYPYINDASLFSREEVLNAVSHYVSNPSSQTIIMADGYAFILFDQLYRKQKNVHVKRSMSALCGTGYGSVSGGGLFLYVSSSVGGVNEAIHKSITRNLGNGKACVLIGDIAPPAA